MLKLKKIKVKEVAVFFQKLPLILGKNAFLTFLGLFILAVIFASFIFYTNYILIKDMDFNIIQEEFKFDLESYQEILEVWQEKEQRFKKTDSKSYPNPFVL
jgi:hypothetical protein